MTQKERKIILKKNKAELQEAKNRARNGKPLTGFQKELLMIEDTWYAQKGISNSYIAIGIALTGFIINAVILITKHCQ